MTILDNSVVDNLVEQVRDATDESNTADVSTAKILRALNRAQKKFVRIATRKRPAFFKREITLTESDFTGRQATIPESIFGLIINEVHIIVNGLPYKVTPLSSSQSADVESSTTSSIAGFYSLVGDKFNLYPGPSGNVTVRIRGQIRPPDLVLQQGRITNIGSVASGILFVDSAGDDLSTNVSDLTAFINIIDGMTGLVKSTLQVSAVNTTTGQLTVKTSGLDRTLVFGRTVDDAIPDTVALDDYVCLSYGTCIPTLARDYDDFLVAFATLEIKRSMGDDTAPEYSSMKELEKDVELMWAGRPQTMRINRRSSHWNRASSILAYFRY